MQFLLLFLARAGKVHRVQDDLAHREGLLVDRSELVVHLYIMNAVIQLSLSISFPHLWQEHPEPSFSFSYLEAI